jgi:hypothetical protein
MASKIRSWKEKIDPAFDRIIKKFIQLFDLTEFPANSGWVIPENEYFHRFNKKFLHGWIVSYEKEMTRRRKRGQATFSVRGIWPNENSFQLLP